MSIFDHRPAPQTPRRFWLLLLPVAAALIWVGYTASLQRHQLRRALHTFRGDSSADSPPNISLAEALQVRSFLLNHPHPKLSGKQAALLIRTVQSHADELSQSEALDVLSMAKRAEALSSEQAAAAQKATLGVLRTSPGPMVRLESARLLGHLGNAAAVPALTLLQTDIDPKVQQAAQTALERIGRR